MAAAGDQTKARLLTEARDLYLEQGFARFSLREVARRAGISAAAVYRHFDDKQALLSNVCAAGFRIFSSYLLQAHAARTPRARLSASTLQYLRFAVENPRDYRFIFMGAKEDFTTLAPPPDNIEGESTFRFLVDRVGECMQAHVIKKADPFMVATVIWGHVHGLVSLRLSGHLASLGSDAQFARFYEKATEQLLAGLAP
jgi:AcrR family transcriptional regulator